MPGSDYSWTANPLLAGATLRLLIALAALACVAAATIAALYFYPQTALFVLPLQAVVLALSVLTLATLMRRVYLEVIRPIGSVRDWAQRIRHGDYAARFSLPDKGNFAGLLRDLSQMGRWYKEISVESDQQTNEQVLQMARKTRLLEILYDIAATISVSRDLNDILAHFLHIAVEITRARAALVRLSTEDGDMVLAHAAGERRGEYAARIPLADVIPARRSKINSVYITAPASYRDFSRFKNGGEFECVIVPLLHQGEVMGAYEILVDQSVSSMSYDMHELLTSIGFHLGLAVHKAHLDEEAQKQSISQERLGLAHELHDSLAQSMASLRFQCEALQGGIDAADLDSAAAAVSRLRQGVDRANDELRELLAHFRAPIDRRGLKAALSRLLKQFREENDVLVFTQFHCEGMEPPLHVQRQVIRIAQEALANIHKHAGAHIVRLLLRTTAKNSCNMLLEDDGHGFADRAVANADEDGRHIGLKVMRERAAYIGAKLTIESEPNEGTRVELAFRWDV